MVWSPQENDAFFGEPQENPDPAEPIAHVAWCRYVTKHERPTRIVLCDSDAEGAFPVFRNPHAAEALFYLRAALDQKNAEYEDLKRCRENNARNQGLKIETLLRGINDARALIDPIWRHRMGAEQVREHIQRGLRCIDSAITDCRFTEPPTEDRIEKGMVNENGEH